LRPVLSQLFPSSTVELVRLTKQSVALKSDISDVDGVLEVLRAAAHFPHHDRVAVTGAALSAVARPRSCTTAAPPRPAAAPRL
jgi:hypothetical protein